MRLAESQKRSASFCNGFLRYIFSFHSCRYYRNDLTSYEQRSNIILEFIKLLVLGLIRLNLKSLISGRFLE